MIGNAKKFAKNAKIVQIDIDPVEINKNIRVNASIIGDVKEVLKRLNRKLEKHQHEEWVQSIMKLKDHYPLKYNKDVLTGPGVVEEIYKVTGGDAIITTEVGQNQMWAAQFYKYKKPHTFITSGGLGTMGYGLGACIGAKVGKPDKMCIRDSPFIV